MPEQIVHHLVAAVVAGSSQAAARLISLLENDGQGAAAALQALFPHLGRAYVVGVTGPPGSGKSTLVNGTVRLLRDRGQRVGVVAVDPTSPFTGGALLGDRVRMQDHSTDPEVFVRSMATRGSLGGLAPATGEAVAVLDAWGAATIFVETVGTGQAEVDIVSASDTVVVVTTSGLGDGVQTIKAGVMEIADIFVVNKADRPEADRTVSDLKMALGMAPAADWRPPVLTTVATSGEGIPQLLAAIGDHRRQQEARSSLTARRHRRWRREILTAAEARLRAQVLEGTASIALDDLVTRVASGALDPHTAADELLAGLEASNPRVDHIGIAVRDINAAARFYREVLNLEARPPEALSDDHVTAVFIPIGDTRIELLEPIGADGPIARFLQQRGEGIHHIAIAVPDVPRTLDAARAAGFVPVDDAPRRGAGGHRIAFLHPRDTHGVLIELVEGPR